MDTRTRIRCLLEKIQKVKFKIIPIDDFNDWYMEFFCNLENDTNEDIEVFREFYNDCGYYESNEAIRNECPSIYYDDQKFWENLKNFEMQIEHVLLNFGVTSGSKDEKRDKPMQK